MNNAVATAALWMILFNYAVMIMYTIQKLLTTKQANGTKRMSDEHILFCGWCGIMMLLTIFAYAQ